MPGSERRATVVITEGLIADRTFQQPVVKRMERRGGGYLQHTTEALLLMSFSWGHACCSALFSLKSCQKIKTLSLQPVFDTFWRFLFKSHTRKLSLCKKSTNFLQSAHYHFFGVKVQFSLNRLLFSGRNV